MARGLLLVRPSATREVGGDAPRSRRHRSAADCSIIAAASRLRDLIVSLSAMLASGYGRRLPRTRRALDLDRVVAALAAVTQFEDGILDLAVLCSGTVERITSRRAGRRRRAASRRRSEVADDSTSALAAPRQQLDPAVPASDVALHVEYSSRGSARPSSTGSRFMSACEPPIRARSRRDHISDASRCSRTASSSPSARIHIVLNTGRPAREYSEERNARHALDDARSSA